MNTHAVAVKIATVNLPVPPAVCSYMHCCINEDCIELPCSVDASDGYIFECDVEGVICDDRKPCAGFCFLPHTN